MRRRFGMDIYRTFAEAVFWEDGRLRSAGRIDMTRSGLKASAAACVRMTKL
jgi:transposase